MAAVKKKAAKKKTARKKATKKKVVDNSELESKLGHDPLAWLSGNEEHVVSDSNIVVEPEALTQTEVVGNVVSETVEAEALLSESLEQDEIEEIPTEKAEETGNKDDKTMLSLPDVFGIAQAEIMYQEMKDQLSSTDDINIDASSVEMVDASALQLLIALVNECKSKGKKISWHKSSDKIRDSASLLNLNESLGI